ncbi:MAG: (2Fe-2S)-binding protein [Acidobacteriota bacterium]
MRLSLNNMIVCNCRAASQRDVHSAIQRGAECLSDLKRCGIGDDCGSCHDLLRAMLGRPTHQHPNIPTFQPAITFAP